MENKITEFNFTWALSDGAWVRYANGDCRWEHFLTLRKLKSEEWIRAMIKKQGWMTGCWIKCDD